jgi:uncharacterized phage protein (TIGR01671 family)
MREIKFRAFIKDYGDPKEPNGTMFYHCMPITADFKTWLVSFDDGETFDGDWVVGENFAVMQYTGLKDKNGKEIYEGDILQQKRESMFSSALEEKRYKTVTIPDIYIESIDGYSLVQDSEVIGNIYENPELCK